MASRYGNDLFLIVNNVVMPIPAPTYSVVSAQGVSSGRNAKNQLIGQRVGRRQWKINNLEWHGLTQEDVKKIHQAIEPFYVPVTFTDLEGNRRTIHMYPSDAEGKPFRIENMQYTRFDSLKFNLIDCGWDD